MCIAYGPGLEGGFNNEDLPFTIEAHNYFDDKLPTGMNFLQSFMLM